MEHRGNEPFNPMEDRLWRLERKPLKIYVAAPLSNQLEALRFAIQLQDAGFCVTSRWLRNDFTKRPSPPGAQHWTSAGLVLDPSTGLEYAKYEEFWGEQDLADLRISDTLIVLADKPSTRGGYHVELGHFLGSGKTNIVVVGDRPNVFFWTRDVRWCKDTTYLIEWLAGFTPIAPFREEK